MTMCPFAWEGCLTQSRLKHPRRIHLAQTGTWQAWPPVDLSSTAFTVERVRYTLLYAMAAKVDRLFSTVAVGHPVATQIRARAQQIVRQFQYIGLFEWAVFARKFTRRVRMFVGPDSTDWVDIPSTQIMPSLDCSLPPETPIAFVVDCGLARNEGSGQLELHIQDTRPNSVQPTHANHFAILLDVGPSEEPIAMDPKKLRSAAYYRSGRVYRY